MKRVSLLAGLAALAIAGAAHAQSHGDHAGMSHSNPPTKTQVCLDVGGGLLPVVCKVPASRLDQREDICSCPQGMRTDVAVCGPGQKAPAENNALYAARREAGRDGSLLGDMFQGQPICVAPRG
ncbi:hypothetical protein [Phenylobacterium sp.]|jgi:hypothetical protein|uniref:hypothetical protein n=1 Tax=Phenylobacterium sp. TaxID=1871053 RepID=UPI00300390AF